MSEQTRTATTQQILPAGDDFNDVWSADSARGLVQVATGLYAERLPVADMTVAEIRDSFADRFDIDPQAIPVIDGHRVTDEATRVEAGQQLAFVRYAGEKGSGDGR